MKYLMATFLMSVLVSWVGMTQAAIRLKSADGHEVVLANPPQRIVSLAPNLTEILFDIGAQNQIVGVDKDSNYPKAARKLPIVSRYGSVNPEVIVALHPDLVLAWAYGLKPGLVRHLRELGVPVYLSKTQTLAGVATLIQNLGELTGHQALARHQAAHYLAQLHVLKLKYASPSKPVSVVMQLSDHPLYVASGNSIQTQIIHLCGGVNPYRHFWEKAIRISPESVLKNNPDIIVGATPTSLAYWKQWTHLKAVKSHALIKVNGSWVARNTPRLLLGARLLCQKISHVK